ncbi:MAG: HNH endonuclease signature motif containing protein [Thermodesulfovibrionales bacterium]|nr:HNH endonuclease signature motif containing protein [Thermodesulfovibrionales bacterium]
MIKVKSPINYNYATIKITQSRINKGLIAIPISLIKWFPEHNARIQIYLDDSITPESKKYSSYESKTRECRIGGMAEWFRRNKIKDGDEIVVQLVDKKHFIYRLIPESKYILKTHELQESLDSSENDVSAKEEILKLSKWASIDRSQVVLNEYVRLVDTLPTEVRRYVNRRSNQAKESVPNNLRVLLGDIYQGHCQVCEFWFLKKDNEPYFEVHHINPLLSNNPKNLLVVCPNCHRQFEYAEVKNEFDQDNWLVKVKFNDRIYPVNQIILTTKHEEFIKRLHI